MKTILLGLFYTILLTYITNGFAQCDEDILLYSQSDVDSFATNYNCTIIEANLIIGIDNNPSDITSLAPLSDITNIYGNLEIKYNSDLTTLEGLNNLTQIGGDLLVAQNFQLENLEELQNLTELEGNLGIFGGGLTDLNGLQGLTSIGGSVSLLASSLNDLNGLNNLTNIGVTLQLASELDNLNGLQNLETIGGRLIIDETDLTDLDELSNLTTIGGNVEILVNPLLEDLDGLENLTSIGGDLIMTFNEVLTNIEGLQNLTTIGGELGLIGNNDLINLDGLLNVTEVTSIFITQNNDLVSLEGLQNINGTIESLKILTNPDLTNVNGLQNISNIQGTLEIFQNFNLNNIDDLENIENIGGDLLIKYNLALDNLEGLQNVSDIGGNVEISRNHNLTDLEGLQNLSVLNNLDIDDNDGLYSLNGLQNLSVLNNLNIDDNDGLYSLNGLQNISTITENLLITSNPALEVCCSIFSFIEEIQGNILLYGNSPECSSIEEITESCLETANHIQAIAFFDENENGLLDADEQNMGQAFSLNPSAIVSFSDEDGVAHFYLEEVNDYTLSIEPNSLWNINGLASSVDIVFPDSLFYFPLVPVAEFTVQELDLSSSITRCNQETNYWLTYGNIGTTVTDGYVKLFPDDLATFVYANPPVDSTAGDTLYWFYESLYPTRSEQIHLVYEMPSVDFIEEEIYFEAQMETNEGLGDTKAILSSELICAYDPNDKLVNPSGYGNENYTLFGDTLEYTVRFQNTGNDTAFTVIIEDELSEYLDLNTFRPISSSHPVETRIDVNSRLATFAFNDIYLPDSFVNEVGSHGFIKYQILGNNSLEENTDIQNTANIFFDLNPPIVTNTVSNRMVSVLPSLPVFTANTNELDFGEVAIDESAFLPQILVIENIGELALTIDQFDFQDAAFNSDQIQNLTIDGLSNAEVPIYFEPVQAGSYEGELILRSDVGDLSINLIGNALVGTKIYDVNQTSFKLYPNPNNGRFFLESDLPNLQSVKVQNSLGDLVWEQISSTELLEIDLSKFSIGIYFVIVQSGESTFIEKVIVH